MAMDFSATGEAVLQPDPLAALIDGVSGGN
jgi:hypothetical protein